MILCLALKKEKSNNILIKQPITNNSIKHEYENTNNLSLKQNFFDPSKSSPTNDFMLKLQNRFINYNNNYFSLMKTINFDKE